MCFDVGMNRGTVGEVSVKYPKPRCRSCCKRLDKCKGRRYLKDDGYICSDCYTKNYRSDDVKREFNSSLNIVASPSSSAPPASSSLPLHRQCTFPIYGWTFNDATRISKSLAMSWVKLGKDLSEDSWNEIRESKSYMNIMTKPLEQHCLDRLRIQLVAGTESLSRSLLKLVIPCDTDLSLSEVSLLKAEPGDGLQQCHFDLDVYDAAKQCYTVILYCTDTLSTAVPITPLNDLLPSFTRDDSLPSKESLQLLTSDKFLSKPVEAGESLIFRCTVPHFGTQNCDQRTRFVVFALFHPKEIDRPPTDVQRFPHGVTY